MIDVSDLLTGIALAFVLEGLVWSVFTNSASKAALSMANLPPDVLRLYGLATLAFGVFLVWMIRG